MQGIKWIKAREEANGLVIIQQSQPKYIDKVLHAIENGLPLMIENLPVDIDAVRGGGGAQGSGSCRPSLWRLPRGGWAPPRCNSTTHVHAPTQGPGRTGGPAVGRA